MCFLCCPDESTLYLLFFEAFLTHFWNALHVCTKATDGLNFPILQTHMLFIFLSFSHMLLIVLKVIRFTGWQIICMLSLLSHCAPALRHFFSSTTFFQLDIRQLLQLKGRRDIIQGEVVWQPQRKLQLKKTDDSSYQALDKCIQWH